LDGEVGGSGGNQTRGHVVIGNGRKAKRILGPFISIPAFLLFILFLFNLFIINAEDFQFISKLKLLKLRA